MRLQDCDLVLPLDEIEWEEEARTKLEDDINQFGCYAHKWITTIDFLCEKNKKTLHNYELSGGKHNFFVLCHIA